MSNTVKTGMDPLVTSALVSAGSSAANGLFGQLFAGVNARRDYEYFKKKMNYQDQIQDENIANERAYNSPAAVSARMRAAGLAPQTANNANAGLSSATPGVSTDGAGTGPIPQLDMSALTSRLAQQSTTPVEQSVIDKNAAEESASNAIARDKNADAAAKERDLGIVEDNFESYVGAKLADWARPKILNSLTEKEVDALQNLMDFRDTQSAQGWFNVESNRKSVIAALKQAAAAELNAKVNFSESEYRKANMQKDIEVKSGQIVLNKALSVESDQRRKNLLEEINNLVSQRNLTEQQIKDIKNKIALNWATFGTNTAIAISKEARSWLTFGLSDGAQPVQYIQEDIPLVLGADGRTLAKSVTKK